MKTQIQRNEVMACVAVVKLPWSLVEQIDATAAAEGISRSAVMRRTLMLAYRRPSRRRRRRRR